MHRFCDPEHFKLSAIFSTRNLNGPTERILRDGLKKCSILQKRALKWPRIAQLRFRTQLEYIALKLKRKNSRDRILLGQYSFTMVIGDEALTIVDQKIGTSRAFSSREASKNSPVKNRKSLQTFCSKESEISQFFEFVRIETHLDPA